MLDNFYYRQLGSLQLLRAGRSDGPADPPDRIRRPRGRRACRRDRNTRPCALRGVTGNWHQYHGDSGGVAPCVVDHSGPFAFRTSECLSRRSGRRRVSDEPPARTDMECSPRGGSQRPAPRLVPPVPGFQGVHRQRYHGDCFRTILHSFSARGPVDCCPRDPGCGRLYWIRPTAKSSWLSWILKDLASLQRNRLSGPALRDERSLSESTRRLHRGNDTLSH